MGTCFSTKKKHSSSSSSSTHPSSSASATVPVDANKSDNRTQKVEVVVQTTPNQEEPRNREDEKQNEKEEEGLVKKEIFVIKHRKSHERRSTTPPPPPPPPQNEDSPPLVVEQQVGGNGMVRTSSCTKEEVDAILIQCGRLSRSNSSAKQVAASGRKYSGSKRSYDFDHNDAERDATSGGDDSDLKKKVSDEDDEKRQHRQRHRQSGGSSNSRHSCSPSQGRRRRTPSREREQRSGSRERGNSGGGSGRRVSRSPGRRSDNNNNNCGGGGGCNNTNTNNNNRPGKMVSVPASVNSLVMDKSNNNGGSGGDGIKRISVKRNVGGDQQGGSRTAASPRSQSPARANGNVKSSNENQQQPSLSRSSSRKAEHSPYRRNPLSEIDPNTLAYPQSAANNNKASNANANRVQNRNKEVEGDAVLVKEFSTSLLHQGTMQKPEIVAQGTNHKTSSRGVMNNKVVAVNCTEREHQRVLEEAKPQVTRTGNNVTLTTVVAASGAENQKPQMVTRSRSSRLSRDLDINPETLMNPSPSYTALLLEDIQNFHQKSNNTPSVSLPACVSKACSILEAVADLNSTTSSNLSGAFSEDRKSLPADHANNRNSINLAEKKMAENNYREPFVESEVIGSDDLMEPSFHKYVTVNRGGTTLEGGVDLDDQESSGSNSFVSGSQQNWSLGSSSWEPTSADSTDRWTSRSNTRDQSPLGGFQRHASSETGCDEIKGRKGFSGAKRDNQYEKVGIGRGRVGAAGKGLHTVSAVGVSAST